MDKKDIYEHLAKIYLDVSSQRKKKSKSKQFFYKKTVLISSIFIFALGVLLFANLPKRKAFNSELALVLAPGPIKINFDFNPAKKEIYSLNLNKLNMSRFKALAFALKKANYSDTISLRAEFTSAFNEKSEAYFKHIPHKWQDYKINLSDFKGISDWTEVSSFAISVEEWNTKEKKGVVYIDNIRLLK
jgi:hypothetical protein